MSPRDAQGRSGVLRGCLPFHTETAAQDEQWVLVYIHEIVCDQFHSQSHTQTDFAIWV